MNNPNETETKALWAVMKAHAWDNITTPHGIPLMRPAEGPHRFIPVFNTREQAVKWAGSDEHVVMLVQVTANNPYRNPNVQRRRAVNP